MRKSKRPKRRPDKRLQPYSEEEAATWFQGKAFGADWTTWHFPNWAKLLKRYRGRSLRLLEIGSWEGRSALFFLNHLPHAQVTCIDTFAGGQEHQDEAKRSPQAARDLRGVERRFDANTKAFKKRIEKIKAQSTEALAALGIKNRQFDVAYIDGGHRSIEVYSDAVLTWPLMTRGGLVIFDDYDWNFMPKPLDNPAPGIDAFLASIKGQYRIAHKKYQIAIIKR